MSPDVTGIIAIVGRHRECSEIACNASGTGGQRLTDECNTVDHVRPLVDLLIAIRREVAGFDRAEFEGLYSRLRDIHCLINESEES